MADYDGILKALMSMSDKPKPVNGLLGQLLSELPQQGNRAGPATANLSMLAQGLRGKENQFQRGIQATPWYSEFQQKYGETPNLDDPQYNYRAAWQGGARPERYAPDGGAYHWPSSLPNGQMLKAPDHPTAWMETFMRQTGKDPAVLGLKTPQDAERYLQERKPTPFVMPFPVIGGRG